jgi:fatty acid amide hydrolase
MTVVGEHAMESASSIAVGVVAGASAREVLAEHVRRHAETHPRLNALVLPRHEHAAVEAAGIDAGDRRGLTLAGVPVSVKECFAVTGLPTTLGIRKRRGIIDTSDCAVVSRLRQAGAVIVGKANVPQAMYLHETDNPVHGRTNHPDRGDRGPGGSSGGDAALVAAGVVPLAVGNDLAGSIRQPAHACGVYGFLPRSVALGEGGAFDNLPGLQLVRPRAGFLARCVADLRLVSRTLLGEQATISRSGPLRIGWWDDAGPLEASAAVRRGVAAAVARLVARGAVVERVDGSLATEAAWLHLALMSADGGADIKHLFAGERPIPPVQRLLAISGLPHPWRRAVTWAARLTGRRIEAAGLAATGPLTRTGLARLAEARGGLAARVESLARQFDALVCPVSALPALRHGTAATLVLAAAPCLLANFLDLPAGTVPVGRVRPDEESGRTRSGDPVLIAAREVDRGSAGLPIGVQVVGLRGGEATVLECLGLIGEPALP